MNYIPINLAAHGLTTNGSNGPYFTFLGLAERDIYFEKKTQCIHTPYNSLSQTQTIILIFPPELATPFNTGRQIL